MKKLNKKTIIIILAIFIITLPITATFSKYVVKKIGDYILVANHFYFNSDKLKENGASYEMNNWTGASNINIQFELNNRQNNLLTSSSDIDYKLSVSCPTDVTCTLDSEYTGIIYATSVSKSFNLTLNPTRTFNENESISVTVNAESTSPYVKKLSATYKITVGKKGIAYSINDVKDNNTFNFVITNALDYYTVKEAFSTNVVGNKISYDNYKNLTLDNQAKCTSYKVTLSFDPRVVILDPTSEIVEKSTETTTTINNIQYINSLTFKVDALSSTSIRFYKINKSIDYTYPITNSTSIVTFSAEE